MTTEVYDGDRNLRATIAEDGSLYDAGNTLIGFLNENGSAGDADESFLGEINDDGQLIDSKDEIIGSVDEGNGEIRLAGGAHFATIEKGGDIVGSQEQLLGKADNFTYHKLRQITAYLLLFDQALVDPSKPSKVVPT